MDSIAGDAHFFEDTTSPSKVRQYLDSSKETDKLKGMKWLLAMLSKGKNVSDFFPDVVKNVIVKSVEVKKMVYNYLVHYADFNNACRELALLSINSFQKDMSGTNQLIRGMALRVLTSIRLPDIIQIQLLGVKKCASDSSPYVRKCAATACSKIYSCDPEQLTQLQQILSKLLSDSSTMVLGSAICTFNEICPTNYTLLHKSFRKICHLLADLDEWSQIQCLEVITRYVRNQFLDPDPGAIDIARLQSKQRSVSAIKGKLSNTIVKKKVIRKAFYSDEEDELDEEAIEIEEQVALEKNSYFSSIPKHNESNEDEIDIDLDADHRLILRSAYPLLKSRNSGVVLGVCTLHYYCAPKSDSNNMKIGKSLVRILRNHREIQYVVLNAIQTIACDHPLIFRSFLSDFFIKSSDPLFIRLLKLDILTLICYKDNIIQILKELQVYIKSNSSNSKFINASIIAIGRIADCDPDMAIICLEGLMHLLLCSKVSSIIDNCVIVLRQLIQQNIHIEQSSIILFQLTKLLLIASIDEENKPNHDIENIDNLKIITSPETRSSIIWMIGEYYDIIGKASIDILRLLAINFSNELTIVKMQILTFATKLSLRFPDDDLIQNLVTYVLELSRYDMDTDLRDRSRFMTALMGLAPSASGDGNIESLVDETSLEELSRHAKHIILSSKLPPVTLLGAVDVEGMAYFITGSLSSIVGHYAIGYEPLANWPSSQPDPNVRDVLRFGNQENVLGEANAQSYDNDNEEFYSDDDSESSDESDSSEEDSDVSDSDEDSEEDSDEDSEEESESDESDESEEESDESDDDDSDDTNDDDSSDESDESEEEKVVMKQNVQPRSISGMRRVTSSGSTSHDVKVSALTQDFNSSLSLQSNEAVGFNNMQPMQPTPYLQPTIAPSVGYGVQSHPMQPTGFPLSEMYSTMSASTTLRSNIPVTQSNDQFQNATPYSSAPMTQTMNFAYTNTNATSNTTFAPLLKTPSDDNDPFRGLSSINTTTSSITPMNIKVTSPNSNHMSIVSNNSSSSKHITSPSHSISQHHLENASDPKVILKPDVGGGLEVSFITLFGVPASAFIGATVGYITIKNYKDHVIRRIKISLPSEVRHTSIVDTTQLQANEEIKIPTEISLQGLASKPIRVDIRSDLGSFQGILVFEAYELLLPFIVSIKDFIDARNKLKGLNSLEKVYSFTSLGLLPGKHAEIEILNLVKKMMNIYIVQDIGFNELMFAGLLKKGMIDEHVYISIISQGDNLILKLHCDDALLPSIIVNAFSQAFSSWRVD